MRTSGKLTRWLVVVSYAMAMAWVEAAVVFYLRTMIDRIEPYQPNPFPVIGNFASTELTREAATLVMLLAVGALAGRTWRGRLGYTAVAFGVWDIFYYLFLKVMCGWPHSLLDWDVLFLLPLPWWGPVLAPVLIALLMIAWGTLASQVESQSPDGRGRRRAWLLNMIGMGLALYVFMADTLRVANLGVDEIRNMLPAHFNWPLFCVAFTLMTVPMIRLCRQLWLQSRLNSEMLEVTREFSCKRSPHN